MKIITEKLEHDLVMPQSHIHFQGSLPQLCQHVAQVVHLVPPILVIHILHLDMLLIQSMLGATAILHIRKYELPRRTDHIRRGETPCIAGSRCWGRHLVLATKSLQLLELHLVLELLVVVELDILAVPVHGELGAGGLASQDGGGRHRVEVGWQGVSHMVVGHGPWHSLDLLREWHITPGSGEGLGGVSTAHGVRGIGPSHLLGGKVPCSILPPLELSETCSSVVLPILVTRTVPLSVGEITRGLADRAHEGPQHRAGHQARGVLQLVALVLSLSFSVGMTELASIHLLDRERELEGIVSPCQL